MAIQKWFTGFEGGNWLWLTAQANVGQPFARTGDYGLRLFSPTAVTTVAAALWTTGQASLSTSGVANGERVRSVTRFAVKWRAFPSASINFISGGGTGYLTLFRVHPDGTFNARLISVDGSAVGPMPLDEWLIVEIFFEGVKNPTGSGGVTSGWVRVSREDGTEIGFSSAANTMVFQPGPSVPGLSYPEPGNGGVSASIDVLLDDFFFSSATGDADVADCVFPPFAVNRVSPVMPTGVGSQSDFGGDWRAVLRKPYTGTTGAMTSNVAGDVQTFSKKTAAQLGLGNIHAVLFMVKHNSGTGNIQHVLWNGSALPHRTSIQATDRNSWSGQDSVNIDPAPSVWGEISHGDFDTAEMGFRNTVGANIVLTSFWMEVLHDGQNPVRPTDISGGVGSWKHKILPYTGNGAFQEITGVGFKPSFILVKRRTLTGANTPGAVKTAGNCGTSSIPVNASMTQGGDGLCIMLFTEDGFLLGPNNDANENGVAYLAICIQDGGLGANGHYMKSGVYIGNGQAGHLVDIGMQPDLVLTLGGLWKWRDKDHSTSDCMTVGSSTDVANLITALNTTGFELGADSGANQLRQFFPWVAFRRADENFDEVFAQGIFTASGTTGVVTGLPASPAYVMGDRPTTGDASWRANDTLVPAHSGNISSNWSSQTQITTAFTSLTADGFTLGSNLAQNGQTLRWFSLFQDEAELPAMSFNEHNEPPSGVLEDYCAVTEEPFVFVSVVPPAESRQWYAQADLPDGSNYYGGWKEDRLLAVSEVKRSLSGPSLDYQVGTFNIELADDDYAIREFLASTIGGFYSRWEIDAYMITPTGRRNFNTALKLATGQVDSDPQFDTRPEAMTVQLACRDRLGVAMGWTNTGQSRLPRRVLNQTTLPGVVSTMNGKGAPLPWGILSTNITPPSGFSAPTPNGIASRGSSVSGAFWVAGYAPWDQSVAPVTGLSVVGVAGGDCPERTYAVQVFPVGTGERVGDPTPYVVGDVQVTITNPDQIIDVSWVASPDAVKYYVVLSAFYFGWREQQIIETTGTSVQFNHAFDTPSPGTGFADGAVSPAPTGARYYSARSKNGPIVSSWHEVEDPALYPEQTGMSFGLPNGRIRPLRLYWNPATGAEAYQIKKRAAGPFTPLIFNSSNATLEDGLFYWDDDWNDSEAIQGDAVPERAVGKVKAHYVRDVQLPDGDTWQELIIAGAPIKQVDDWYYDPGGDSSNVEVNQDDGTDFVFPKPGTAWDSMFPTRYRDILGSDGITRRYTMGYARGEKGRLIASGISLVSVNLQGIEDVGDCSGDVITDLHDQTVHELNYFVVASGEGYTTGLWGPVPTQGFEDTPVVDSTSFETVRDMRLQELSGGYIAAGITGADGELIDVSTWLKRRQMSGDFRLGPNRLWQISCHAINESLSPLFVSNDLTDEFDIHNRSFRPMPRLSELQNVFQYRYDRNYVLGGWNINDQSYRDELSISNWNLTKQGEDLEFYYIADSSVAGAVLQKHVNRRINAPMYVTLEGSMCLLSEDYDIGEYFKLRHWRGVGDGGWTDRVMWIISNTFIPETKRVRLECLDVTSLLGDDYTNALLEEQMDIDLGGSWYNEPVDIVSQSDFTTVAEAYEYRDRRVVWGKLPAGTSVTARFYGAVVLPSGVAPSGISLTLSLWDPDNLVTIATDPTPFMDTDFELHTFVIPVSNVNRQYRLRASVTHPSGYTGDFPALFNGVLRTDLP